MSETVDLSRIVSGLRTRLQPVSPEDDEQLAASIGAVGVLEPVLLRPARSITEVPDAPMSINGSNQMLEIVKGARRVAAARLAGLTRIPAVVREMSDEEALTEQATDALHAAMHPVDQWLAMQAMVEAGMVPAQAGRVLGLTLEQCRRFQKLGTLHPSMQALCRRLMPDPVELRVIALATQEVQAAVAERELSELNDPDWSDGDPDWNAVANQCRRRFALKAWAVFDTNAVSIDWQQDLFAEPGSKEEFETSDVDAFRNAQRAALQEKVATDKRAVLIEQDPRTSLKPTPAGWRIDYGLKEPSRGQKTAYVLMHSGQVEEWVLVKERPAEADDASDDAGDQDNDGADDDDNATDAAAEAPAPPPPPDTAGVTKAGVALIQARKTDAVRAALAEDRDAHDLLTLMILLFAAGNVRVTGVPYEQTQALGKLPGRLIGPAVNVGKSVRPLEQRGRGAHVPVLAGGDNAQRFHARMQEGAAGQPG